MRFQFNNEVRNDQRGFSQIGKLEQESKNLSSDNLVLDLTKTFFFEAQLSAILGAILNRSKKNGNTIDFGNNKRVEQILQKIELIFNVVVMIRRKS